jgi:hypothetical protein
LADGCTFCLVTNALMLDQFEIEPAGGYSRSIVVPFDDGDSFEDLLDRVIPEPAHVLIVSPDAFFTSPAPERIGRRKLAVMACNSTPTSVDAIAHFLEIIERTDPEDQRRVADHFFGVAESSQRLTFVNDGDGVAAVFHHAGGSYAWNQQAGPLEWGEQQIAPAGELSVLPVDILQFDATRRLAINGDIAFRGLPVLHAGTPPHLREDQARVHAELACILEHAVIATVRNGMIERLRSTHPEAESAREMLETMFEVDSRYRIIWEVGFGINTALATPLPGNHAMNEVFGATVGVAHWGLGLTPDTQYALILPSLGTRVLGANGVSAFPSDDSPPKSRMRRRSVGGCVCHS